MVDKKFAEHFASDWIDSWNSHDMNRILSHYADDFEMSSPVIVQTVGEPSGTLMGKGAVGAYWTKALQLIPDLRFELLTTLIGINSITLHYQGARGRLAAEVFHFGTDRRYRGRTQTMPSNDFLGVSTFVDPVIKLPRHRGRRSFDSHPG